MSWHRYLKIIYWNFEPEPDFPWKSCLDRLPSQFSQKSWFHKNHKTEGQPWFFFQNPYFAHNSTPVGANVCEIKTTPHIRSFSRCSFRQTATLTGPNDRIEPNYFLYRDVNFFTEKNSCFFGSPECVWLLRASPEQKYDEKIEFLRK